MKKKLLSVLLCVCMAMGLLPTTALATSKTADDAIAWARSQVGHSVGAAVWLTALGGGILDPQGPATRAQVAQMLKNYLDK